MLELWQQKLNVGIFGFFKDLNNRTRNLRRPAAFPDPRVWHVCRSPYRNSMRAIWLWVSDTTFFPKIPDALPKLKLGNKLKCAKKNWIRTSKLSNY
jgi:hypothetical protein